MTTAQQPTIRVIARDVVRTQYRIEGGDIAPEWRGSLKPGEAPWCDFAVWQGAATLGSYGGSVWPTAWPTLFQPIAPSVHFGSAGIEITEAGRAALARATP